jgi:hypothetical protein
VTELIGNGWRLAAAAAHGDGAIRKRAFEPARARFGQASLARLQAFERVARRVLVPAIRAAIRSLVGSQCG